MLALLYSLAIVTAAFWLHVGVWHIRTPRRQTRSVLSIFFGTLTAALAGSAAGLLPPLPGPAEYVQVTLCVTAMTLGYTITYSALEADSPTLVMIRLIAAAGPDGLPEKDLEAGASDDRLILPRLADLVRDGHVVRDGDIYRLTDKGRRFVRIFRAYRRLLGAGKGG